MAISSSIGNLFGDSALGQIAEGAFSEEFQRDYTHASKLFRSGDMALMPRQKFLFHVFFTLQDPSQMNEITKSNDKGIIGALVKSIQLPSFTMDTEEYVQYNRKRLVHNSIKYNPIQIVLHDDSDDIVRSMWAKYYEYHFADSSYQYDEGVPGSTGGKAGKTNYNERDIYDVIRRNQSAGWGKTLRHGQPNGVKLPFFKDIKIFGLSQGQFASYTLINPVITSWQHDQYDYSQGTGLMQHTAELRYEAVKYGFGKVGSAVKGFGEASRYDNRGSALGTSSSLTGQGGLEDSVESVGADLASGNLGGAIKTLGSSARTFGSTDNLFDVIEGDIKESAIKDATAAIGEATEGALNFPSLADGNVTTSTPANARKPGIDTDG